MKRTAILTIVAALAFAGPSAAESQEASAAAKAKAKADAERTRVIIEQRERSEEQRREEQRREEQRREERRQERRDDQRAEQLETVSRSVRVGAQGELDLQNMSGSVTVTRGSGNDLKIEAVKKARASTDEAAREMLQLVKIDIVERAGRVEVRTRYPHFEHERPRRGEHRNISVSVAYNITAPAGTRMRINSMSGHISVSDITGELTLEAMSGHVTIERAARVLAAKTMSGNVSLTDAKSDAILNTGSMSGNVTLKQVTARQITAEVVSGTIWLTDVDCERITASTTSGNVVFEGKLAKAGRYKLGAHSGNVKIALSGDTGFELDASSFGGNVRSELTLKNAEQGGADFRRGGPPRAGGRTRSLKGTYGDGSAILDLHTFSGTIVITKRVADKP
jgi:DUF4097 and DUF4098 domain-containing protein YvlB